MGKEQQQGVRKGAWTHEEDALLRRCIAKYGEGKWHHVPSRAGLQRCRKSCRLRWMNYLRPGIKRGIFSEMEVDLILRLHKLLGNRWSLIAGRIPGRTANDIKNHWNTHLSKKLAKTKDMESTKGYSKKTEEAFTVYKPQPRILTISRTWSKEQHDKNGNGGSINGIGEAEFTKTHNGQEEGGTGNNSPGRGVETDDYQSFWMNAMGETAESGGMFGDHAIGFEDMFSYADIYTFLGLEWKTGE